MVPVELGELLRLVSSSDTVVEGNVLGCWMRLGEGCQLFWWERFLFLVCGEVANNEHDGGMEGRFFFVYCCLVGTFLQWFIGVFL